MRGAATTREPNTVRATFDRTEQYLRENSSIPVRVLLIKYLTKGLSYERFIDIGCGDGSIGLSLLDEHKELTLLDLSKNMVTLAQRNTPSTAAERVTYIVGDVHKYAPERPFDLLICTGVVAHVRSIHELLTTIGSLLSESGYLILQFTESHSLCGNLISMFANRAYGGYEMNKTSYRDLKPLLADLGFTTIKRVSYSDSSMGLRRLGFRSAVSFKLFTSWLRMPYVFSESIVLFRRTVKGQQHHSKGQRTAADQNARA